MFFRRDRIVNRSRRYFIKRFLLLIIFLLILLFALIFLIKGAVSVSKYFINNMSDNTLITSLAENQNKSIFNIRELNNKELRNKIILLNVYDIKDFSYIFSVDLANKLEEKYGTKLAIIDVITEDFELDNDIIINYIIKENIQRPVITIKDFDLGIDKKGENKYFVLVDTKGNIVKTFYFNDLKEDLISKSIDNLISENSRLNKDKINLAPEKDKIPEPFIKSLSYIKYIHRIKDTKSVPYFMVVDAKSRKLYLMTINGLIVNQFGSGKKGNEDGNGVNASFCYPSGIVVENNEYVYLADICNNSIRKINLKTLEVSTIIKDNPLLNRPIDVEILDKNLIISQAGENPLLIYDVENDTLEPIKCEICDNYVSKLSKFNNKIYFINNKDYGLYSINKDNEIKQELDFNKLNENNKIKIYGKNNFHIDETGLYIVDKFANKILKIKDNSIKDYSNNDKEKVYNLPNDITAVGDKLYITNDTDKKLIQLNKNTKQTKLINISFGYEYNKIKGIQEEFLNVNNFTETTIKSGTGNLIKINLENGYTFEEMAPQNLALFKEDLENKSAILIKAYSKSDILNNYVLELPELEENTNYYLKGTFYYCNPDKNTPCLINRYNRKIVSSNNSTNNIINIDFLY